MADAVVVDPRVTWEGCSVLLDINDGDRLVFARLSPQATVKIGNKKCSLSSLVGCPFGSLFRLETGPNGPILARCLSSSSPTPDDTNMEENVEAKDNRELLDNNTAQGLSSEDIDAMRSQGATGDEIVSALIANSSTFGKKTQFSQEKYKLKKQKKYAPKVLLRRPYARSICEAYFKKHPTRIGFLRVDTLSLLLSMANISAYSDVLVVDMVGGILTGSVAERLGGTGYVCSTYFGTTPYPIDIVRIFNFSSEVCCRIVHAPFSDLCPSQNNHNDSSGSLVNSESSVPQSSADNAELPADCNPSGSSIIQSEDIAVREENFLSCERPADTQESPFPGDASSCCMSMNLSSSSRDDMQEKNASTANKSVNPGKHASAEAINSWKERGFTSLIVAAPESDVGSIVEELLPLLAYSAPFAIYQQYLQPLATCMHRLQSTKMAIGLQISEPWIREYQVLPSRTHPHMQMSGFGGYILSGTRICSSEACNGNR